MNSTFRQDRISFASRVCANMAAFFVVLIHIPGSGSCVEYIKWNFCSVAVPLFFFLSGYYLSQDLGEGKTRWWVNAVRKRIISIFIPFIIWNAIGVGIFMMGQVIGHHNISFQWPMLGFNFTDHPWVSSLWYLRSLFVFVLFSAFLSFFIRKLGIISLVIISIISIGYHYFVPSREVELILVRFIGLDWLPFFCMGLFCRVFNKFPRLCVRDGVAVVIVAFVCSASVILLEFPMKTLMGFSYKVLMIIGMSALAYNLPPPPTHTLAPPNFAIYLIHPHIVMVGLQLKIWTQNYAHTVMFITSAIIVYLLSWGCATLIIKMTPTLARYLFAGRS